MKYIKSYSGHVEPVVDKMLEANIQNDIILDSTFIIVEMELNKKEDCIGFIYRRLWESVYLRRTDSNVLSKLTFDDKKMIAKLHVSLSEAINYINQITPPIYKGKLIGKLRSVDDIRSMVDFYLNDTTNSTYKHIITSFRNLLNMQKFDTVWKYNNTRFGAIESMMKSKDKSFIGAIDFSIDPVSEFTKYNTPYVKNMTQLTVRVNLNNKTGMLNLIRFLYDELFVINASVDESYLYITLYTEIVDTSHFTKWISTWYGY